MTREVTACDDDAALVRGCAVVVALCSAAAAWRWGMSGSMPSPAIGVARLVGSVHGLGAAALALVDPRANRRWLWPGALVALAAPLLAERVELDLAATAVLAASAVLARLVAMLPSPRRTRAAGVAAGVLVAGTLGLLGVSQSADLDPAGSLQAHLFGLVEGAPAKVAGGRGIRYSLPLPEGTWLRSTPAADRRASDPLVRMEAALFRDDDASSGWPVAPVSSTRLAAERAMQEMLRAEGISETASWTEPRRGTRLRISARALPGAGDRGLLLPVARLTSAAVESGMRAVPEPLDVAGFDHSRLLAVQGPDGQPAGLAGLFARGDLFFVVVAAGPARTFPARRAELRRAIAGFSVEVDTPPVFGEAALARAAAASALVLTGAGSASGWVAGRGDGEVAVVTTARIAGEAETGGPTPRVLLAAAPEQGALAAELAGVDRDADLALLRVRVAGALPRPLALRAAGDAPAGTPVFVTGFAAGARAGAPGLHPATETHAGRVGGAPGARSGAVVALELNFGQSLCGGPVVDAAGEVAAIAIAHVPGTELGFAAPAGRVRALLANSGGAWETAAADPAGTSAPGSAPTLPDDVRVRARAATVVVSAGTDYATGAVVREAGSRLLVAAPFSLVHDAEGRRRKGLQVVFFAGTAHPIPAAAQVARADENDNLAVLSVVRFEGAPAPLPFGDPESVRATEPLHLLGFRPESGGRIDPRVAALRWRTGGLCGRSFGAGGVLQSLCVDAGAGHGIAGGPVLDARGRLVGLAVGAEPGTGTVRAASAPLMAQLLRGAVRGGTLRYVFDGLDRCVLRFDLELDDPLHAITSVGVALPAPPGTEGHAPLLADEFRYGEPAATVQTKDADSAVLEVRPDKCEAGWLGYQLWTEDAAGRRLEPQHWVDLAPTGAQAASREVPPGPLAGDLPAHSMDLKPFQPPAGWGVDCPLDDEPRCYEDCKKDDFPMCFAVGRRVSGSQPDIAARALQRACDTGLGRACEAASPVYETLGDWARSFETAQQACALGLGGACGRLAGLLRRAPDRPPDPAAAVRAAEEGCGRGSAEACVDLTEARARGEGTPADPAASRAARVQACELSSAEACRTLAMEYRDGTGVPADAVQAARLFARSCRLRDAVSCRELAVLQLAGRGTERSVADAFQSMRLACGLKDARGCRGLGRLRSARKGVPSVAVDGAGVPLDPFGDATVPPATGPTPRAWLRSAPFQPPAPWGAFAWLPEAP